MQWASRRPFLEAAIASPAHGGTLFSKETSAPIGDQTLCIWRLLWGGCGAFEVKDFLTPLFQHCWMMIDHMAIPTILQTAQIKTGNDWKQSVDWVGTIFDYCDLTLCSVWPRRKKKLCSVPPNKDKVKSNDQSHIRGLFKGQFWF